MVRTGGPADRASPRRTIVRTPKRKRRMCTAQTDPPQALGRLHGDVGLKHPSISHHIEHVQQQAPGETVRGRQRKVGRASLKVESNTMRGSNTYPRCDVEEAGSETIISWRKNQARRRVLALPLHSYFEHKSRASLTRTGLADENQRPVHRRRECKSIMDKRRGRREPRRSNGGMAPTAPTSM